MGSKYYISVSDLSEYLEGLIKKDPFLNEVDIEGEISGLQIKSQVFFNLKDDKSIIRCVIFDDCLKVLMINYKNGESVKLSGVLNVYKAAGNYQIIVKEIEKSGIGNIYKKVFELKEKLLKEGLFSTFKKPIPEIIKNAGVIVGKNSAAEADIIKTVKRRFPAVNLVIRNVTVQGDNCPREVEEALKDLDFDDAIDVIIISRGGGSFEDLNGFNDEKLLRTAFLIKKPIITAIGHEIDETLIDLIADLRVSTPTAAGEAITPNVYNLIKETEKEFEILQLKITQTIRREMDDLNIKIKALESYNPLKFYIKEKTYINRSFFNINNKIKNLFQKELLEITKTKKNIKFTLNDNFNKIRIEHLKENKLIEGFIKDFYYKINIILNKEFDFLERKNNVLNALNPKNILNKGYSIVLKDGGDKLNSIEHLKINDKLKILFKDGTLDVFIAGIRSEVND